jgi:hypothetical protein
MSSKSARQEYQQAVAEFQRGYAAFARGMETIVESPADASDPTRAMLPGLGPRKPARRAPASASPPASSTHATSPDARRTAG